MRIRFWTSEKIDFIRNNLHMSDREFAAYFNVSKAAIKTIRLTNSIIIRPNNHFTPAEDQILRNLYPNTRTDKLAKQLNRSKYSIYNRAFSLELIKSPEFLASPESGIFTKGSTTGKKYRYPKGHIPANKGIKMSPELREKTKHTFFQKGNKPHNTKTDGVISIRRNPNQRGDKSYKYIRISEANWEQLHRHNWEKENGPIPKGFNVVFKDNDSMNCNLSNLEMISNAELLERNRLTQWPSELQKAIKINNKLKKIIDGRH